MLHVAEERAPEGAHFPLKLLKLVETNATKLNSNSTIIFLLAGSCSSLFICSIQQQFHDVRVRSLAVTFMGHAGCTRSIKDFPSTSIKKKLHSKLVIGPLEGCSSRHFSTDNGF